MKKTIANQTKIKDQSLALNSQLENENDLPALAAGLVHEAKNPLASIHLHLQLLEGYLTEVENPELQKKLQDKVRFIKKEISGLDQSLHGFLKLIQNEAKALPQSLDLNNILASVVELLKPQAQQFFVEIEFQPSDIILLETGNESFIKQTAINLILNAMQSFSQSSEVMKDQKRVIVKTGSKDGMIYMMIVDNGPGIAQSDLKKIFDPYYTTKKEKGSGIGLALVKKMVAQMKAHLEIQSEVGKGTNIAILFAKPDTISK